MLSEVGAAIMAAFSDILFESAYSIIFRATTSYTLY
jgi:hypothetical protein